jgi:16S rRNA (cytosine967-C5)-methyltransferase
MSSPRQLAFIALQEVHKGAYADVALDRVLQINLQDDSSSDLRNRGLVTELVYGCTRRQRTLDALIDQLAKKKSHEQPPNLRTILHLGLYQLCFQERIPASAAVNTTVQLAKENGFSGLTGFVNGLLRQYVRLVEQQTNDLSQNLKLPENPVERLGILYSFPNWIIEVWLQEFGLTQTEQLCEWMNQTPTIDLRVNVLRTSVSEVEAALKSNGVLVRRVPHLPQALRLISNPGSIQNLPGFNQGWWTVQDSSAQLVTHLLDPQPGELVIDACAAPGGKTTHIAELMKDQGKILACDRTSSRLNKLQANAKRLNLQSIQTCIGDSRTLSYHNADRVLLDAPCSGLGTLHRHADARWRQTPKSVQELSIIQKELLSHTSTFVKEGGVLVYATCTLYPQENENVIKSFLESNASWVIDPPSVDSLLFPYLCQPGWMKVLPHHQDMDGFFMVRLKKTNSSG